MFTLTPLGKLLDATNENFSLKSADKRSRVFTKPTPLSRYKLPSIIQHLDHHQQFQLITYQIR